MSTTCPTLRIPSRSWLKGVSDPGGGGGGLHMSTTCPSLRIPSRSWLKGVSDPRGEGGYTCLLPAPACGYHRGAG